MKETQLKFMKTSGWGGKRNGAGRKSLSKTVCHMKRELICAKHPLNLTLRLKEQMPNLRQNRLLKEFQKGIQLAAKHGLFVIQYSLQSNHIHLLVEAKSNSSLARGMQSLVSRFAKIIRKHKGGRGSVFVGRYHLRSLKTPTEMKRALQYVLLNSAKHKEMIEHLDPFSSAFTFEKWPQLIGQKFAGLIRREVLETKQKLRLIQDVFEPQTWLAREGWLRGR